MLGVDYLAVSNTFTFPAGQSNIVVTVPIRSDPAMLNNSVVDLLLTNASGTFLFNPSAAYLTILTTNTSPGEFLFSQTNYFVVEAKGAVVPVTVVRTNGHTGSVNVNFATFSLTNSTSAIPGFNHAPTNGTLTFADGELSKTIYIPIFLNPVVEGNLSFTLTLSNPSSGTRILQPASVPIVILGAIQGVGFPVSISVTNETAPAIVLSINRLLTNGVTTVQYATADGTAVEASTMSPPKIHDLRERRIHQVPSASRLSMTRITSSPPVPCEPLQ